jgi:aerobic carbon-monoxide dehydrogenase medium subunit
MSQGPEVLIPTSAAEAVELFGTGTDTAVVGGGTILIPMLRLSDARPARALMLHHAGLAGISETGGRLTIGAMTPLSDLASLADPIAACVAHIADLEIRGQATLGGNLCARNTDAPRGDLQGAMIALGASVRSVGAGGERAESAEDFLANRDDRLVLDVSFDLPAAGAYAYLDRAHTHEYTALAVSAVRTSDGTIRLGANGAGPHGLRLPSAESAAGDHAAAGIAALADVALFDDAIASAWYREKTLPVLVRRALDQLKEAA